MPKKPVIDKELFKRSVSYNVKTLYRKTLEEATDQQIFQAVSYAVKDMIVDNHGVPDGTCAWQQYDQS